MLGTYTRVVENLNMFLPKDKENPQAQFNIKIVVFYSRKGNLPSNQTFEKKWKEILTHIEIYEMDTFDYLGSYCYAEQIGKHGSTIGDVTSKLHSAVSDLIKQRSKPAVDESVLTTYTNKAKDARLSLISAIIPIYEQIKRAKTPDIHDLMRKVMESKLPRQSQVTPDILICFELAWEKMEILYKPGEILTAEGMTD
ncbi:hypothetical protein RF11_05137 [Thelohanellus kitauei]|uniref:Uncharacterized protein n=1 Tax=Thelohanellus kitauei TaxID=669202 RepID=A0A0C2MKF2_THEKT|nr:hypothetical protein RF11_05137 [Thelohanellus kitauei]